MTNVIPIWYLVIPIWYQLPSMKKPNAHELDVTLYLQRSDTSDRDWVTIFISSDGNNYRTLVYVICHVTGTWFALLRGLCYKYRGIGVIYLPNSSALFHCRWRSRIIVLLSMNKYCIMRIKTTDSNPQHSTDNGLSFGRSNGAVWPAPSYFY